MKRKPAWMKVFLAKWMPEGWSLDIDPDLNWRGRAVDNPKGGVITLRQFNNNPADKLILLHEIGHVVCGHMRQPDREPFHVEEYEAEQFAIWSARITGIPVSASILFDAKANVKAAINEDSRVETDPVEIRKHVLNWVEP